MSCPARNRSPEKATLNRHSKAAEVHCWRVLCHSLSIQWSPQSGPQSSAPRCLCSMAQCCQLRTWEDEDYVQGKVLPAQNIISSLTSAERWSQNGCKQICLQHHRNCTVRSFAHSGISCLIWRREPWPMNRRQNRTSKASHNGGFKCALAPYKTIVCILNPGVLGRQNPLALQSELHITPYIICQLAYIQFQHVWKVNSHESNICIVWPCGRLLLLHSGGLEVKLHLHQTQRLDLWAQRCSKYNVPSVRMQIL